MRAVIVTGDRHAKSEQWGDILVKVIDWRRLDLLIHGDADGIDELAGVIAKRLQISYIPVPAQWETHGGKAAGPRRNAAMLKILLTLQEHGYTVGVIAFHDNLAESKGTKNMTEIAREAGVPVVLYRSDGTREVLK